MFIGCIFYCLHSITQIPFLKKYKCRPWVMMKETRLSRLFGVGPGGAFISLCLLAAVFMADRLMGHVELLPIPGVARIAGVILFAAGAGLHVWSFITLRHWWTGEGLCMQGPFKYFRHPMYAAWITFIAAGFVLYLNSWLVLICAVLLHPLWHRLVVAEEKMMLDRFGDVYRAYAAKTGRFVPRFFRWNHSFSGL